MRILWLSHLIPYPPRGGNLQRSFNLIRQAARSHEVSLVALNTNGEGPERVAEYTRELKKYCETVDIWEPPYPWKGLRWQVELLRSAVLPSPFSCRARFSSRLHRSWEEKLAQYPGALVHIDSIDLAMFVPATKDFHRVLNHHNCESVLAFRRAQSEPEPMRRTYLGLEARKLARWEHRLLSQCEVNTAVCEEDRQRLLAINPSSHIHIVENGVDTNYFQPVDTAEEPRSVVYTASLNWAPNASAAQFLTEEVWPLVERKCSGAKLYIAGRDPPQSVRRLARADSTVTVVPNPDDIRPIVARANVYVCPLREGAGTRLKILDAMAMGKPVVSTSIGCEGLRVTPGENILVADEAHTLAESVLRLLADEEFRNQLGRSGRRFVEQEYAWERVGNQLEKAYQCAMGANGCAGERT